jgi:hypothetical protein
MRSSLVSRLTMSITRSVIEKTKRHMYFSIEISLGYCIFVCDNVVPSISSDLSRVAADAVVPSVISVGAGSVVVRAISRQKCP